ncbi:MAG: PAS domain S-box protein, partial [Bacteroidota bacterium]
NRFKKRNGNYSRLSWKLIYIPEEKVFYAQAQDIEEKWEKEEALKKLNQELTDRNQQLKDQEAELSQNQKLLRDKQSELSEAQESTSLKQELIEGIARAIPAEINAFDYYKNVKLFSNSKLAPLLQYLPDEFLTFGEDPLLQLAHPDDLPHLEAKRNLVKQGEKVLGTEIRLRHKAGHYQTILMSLVPLNKEIPGLALCILQDLSKQKSAENELKKLNKRLQEKNQELAHKEENLKRNNERLLVQRENIQHTLEKLLQSQTLVESIAKALPAELNALDVQNNQMVFSNHKLAQILGYDSEKLQLLVPDPISYLIHPQDLSHFQTIPQELENQEISLREVRVKHSDGHYLWLSVISVLLKEEARASRYQVTMIQDITERKIAEEKISASNEKLIANQAILERALAELSDRNFELDQIVYKISHDLRSPLSTILGLVN